MIDRDSDVSKAIRLRDIRALVTLMFPERKPTVGKGFKTETDLWEYKRQCPYVGKEYENAWAEISKDICSFHNVLGGVIVFGIDNERFEFFGCRQILDSKLVNDRIRRYLGDKIWVEYHREFIQEDQSYVGLLVIPPRGPAILRFKHEAPPVDGKVAFSEGDIGVRFGDSSVVLRGGDAEKYVREAALPIAGEKYAVEKEFFRILAPEYRRFVERPIPMSQVMKGLRDTRTAVTAIVGIGGMGKTALATWATLQAYDQDIFDLIVSVTAKDRELTATGITALEPSLTSFEALLDTILETTGFSNYKEHQIVQKEREVHQLLDGSNGLLYVDNLETVDDQRIIRFLDDLPSGVRAITTSRRTTVRVATRPVDLGPMDSDEVIAFMRMLAEISGSAYLGNLTMAEMQKIGEACDGIPLAIRWTIARASTPSEALSLAEGISRSGRSGEELLEFTFRRVFDAMSGAERAVLQVLSLFQRPLQTEAIVVGGGLPQHRLLDALEVLVSDALVQRFFDETLNDYSYGLLPATRAFVYTDVCKRRELEPVIRRRLTDYFEATDISDQKQRVVIRELRQGKGKESETPLLDLARAAERQNNDDQAEELYRQALRRNPSSWKAARALAEFQRHRRKNTGEALRLYEQAAANAPSRGKDRALIYREWGMMLRDSGLPGGTQQAIEKFEVALEETPNDAVARHALAHMLSRTGRWTRVINLLEPMKEHESEKTRTKTMPLLLEAYEARGEIVKAAILRAEIEGSQNG